MEQKRARLLEAVIEHGLSPDGADTTQLKLSKALLTRACRLWDSEVVGVLFAYAIKRMGERRKLMDVFVWKDWRVGTDLSGDWRLRPAER